MRKILRHGIISIAFDDGYLDTYLSAVKYLTKCGLKCTIAVPLSFLGKDFEKRPLVGLKELKAAAMAGHEIASHTFTHPNLLRLSEKDKKTVAAEVLGSKMALQKLLKKRVYSFIFPYIKRNQTKALREKVKKYYTCARITLDKPCFNRIPLPDSCAVKGFAVMKKHSLSYLKGQVDYACKKKLWLIEVFHLVGMKNTLSAHRPKPYRFFMHIDDFKKHIDYILAKGIPVLTQKDAVKKLSKFSV